MPLLSKLQKVFHVRPAVAGCDISDHCIRLAILREEKGTLTLSGFAAAPLPEGVVVNGVIMDRKRLADELRKAARGGADFPARVKYVVASLPEPQSFIRIVQLPKLTNAEITQAITLEVEANIPLPLSDVYFDWEVSPRSQEQDHLDVLVAAAPKSLVEEYHAAFLAGGLRPVAFEIDALSTARSVIPGERPPDAALLIDVSRRRATFVIYAGMLVRFAVSIPVMEKSVVEGFPAGTLKEIGVAARQYIEFFQTHATHTHLPRAEVQQVLLCGDGSFAPGFLSSLTREIGISVSLANPWVNILRAPLREVPRLPYKDSLGYAAVLGLALRGHSMSL